ncbi:MAG TPA: LysM peptidoglycan-binding domain-containing M23 family metallopeptidase [Alphaproteobacteria bacterium]|nr:LysM peptidoglycan-binding domain-containing M23 family metallopeptidase [Alphaproteobacteria bacterium]
MNGNLSFLFLCIILTGCVQSGGGVPVHNYGEGKKSGSLGLHTVRQGETLWAISQAYHVDLRDLLDLNSLSPPYSMQAGTRIAIPAPRTYTVQRSDTLYRVSRMFDTTTTDLARLNGLRSPYILKKGQSLRLPAVRKVSPPPVKVAAVASLQPSSAAGVKAPVSAVHAERLSAPRTQTAASSRAVPMAALPQTPVRSSSGFLTPVSGRVISAYGPKKDGLHNDGINIKAAKGTAVRASENGTVVYAGNEIEGYGNLVLIRHSGGYITAYAHLDKMLVRKGEVIKRGSTIGTVGSSGHVDTPQLHFEIRQGKKALNPSTMIRI